MKSEWEELTDILYPIAQKLCWTQEDSDQLLYKVRHPEWDQIRFDILMEMFRLDEIPKEEEWEDIYLGNWIFEIKVDDK
jgi:hypothetical protein